MTPVQNDIYLIFKEIMMDKIENMDTKMFNYWVNAITTESKTKDDFKTFLLKSQDYNNLIRTTFIDTFYEKLSDKNYQELFQEFQEQFIGKQVHEEDIVKFITNSDLFKNKYNKTIVDMYELINEKLPSSEEVNMYLSKFQSNISYDIDNLRNDISNGLILRENPSTVLEDESSNYTEQQQKEIATLWNNKSLFLEFYRKIKAQENVPKVTKQVISNDVDVLHLVNCYENIFERNMNVREYLLYINDIKSFRGEQLVDVVKALKQKHYDVFIKARDVVSRFLNEDLDEDTFIRDYLKDINNINFVDELRQSIISSKNYEVKMCERLVSLYKTLYDECLMDNDVIYIFNKVRNTGCDIMNEELNNFIVEFKNETEHITERIFKIYLDTFEREPDIYEIAKFVELYRKYGIDEFNKVDDIVLTELTNSLEYHDVIKQKIKKIYTINKNANILPSIIYMILGKVLHCGDKTNVDTHIERFIQEL